MNGQRLFVGATIAAVLALGTIGGAARQASNPTPASGGPWNCGPWSHAGGMMPGTQQGPGMMGGAQGDWTSCGWNGMGPGMMDQGMMGPGMMWNGRWGMMASVGAAAQYDEAAAQQVAETFLAGYLPDASVLEGTAFPGYYTFDYGRGQAEGMLSVNAATGDIWVHTWHGPALTEQTP